MKENRRIELDTLPPVVLEFMKEFGSKAYEVFLVGGAIRDLVMNKYFSYGAEPNDYDFATSTLPEDVVSLFEEKGYTVVPTGIEYGTVTVLYKGEQFEVTTYRKDVEYKDGRRPDVISFSETIEEDLARRDFTMNAMALGLDGDIRDPYDGFGDLELGVIDFVGDAETRLYEDGLRVMRLARFAARFGLKVDPETPRIDIAHISAERKRDELSKTIMTDNPKYGLELMRELGILEQVLPDLMACYDLDQLNPYHDKTVYYHILEAVSNTEKDLVLRLSALFHDIGKPKCKTVDENGIGHFYMHESIGAVMVEEIMDDLKFPKAITEKVKKLVKFHMVRSEPAHGRVIRRFIRKFGDNELLPSLFKLKVADRLAGSKARSFDFSDIYRRLFDIEAELEKNPPLDVSLLHVNGHDMMELGFKGKEIGEALELLLESVLDDPELNVKHLLIKEAKDIYKTKH